MGINSRLFAIVLKLYRNYATCKIRFQVSDGCGWGWKDLISEKDLISFEGRLGADEFCCIHNHNQGPPYDCKDVNHTTIMTTMCISIVAARYVNQTHSNQISDKGFGLISNHTSKQLTASSKSSVLGSASLLGNLWTKIEVRPNCELWKSQNRFPNEVKLVVPSDWVLCYK